MTLTKTDIVESMHNQLGFPKNHSAEMVETLLEIIKESLELGEDVLISGFGKSYFEFNRAVMGIYFQQSSC